MNATFSEAEYRRLILLAFLGEWMVNAIRKETDPTLEDVVEKLCSYARETNLVTFGSPEGGDPGWAPAEAIESEAHTLIDEYDDKTFWEELTARLTERDLIDRHGARALGGMRPGQRERAANAIAKAYTKEFEEHGLDRLGFEV